MNERVKTIETENDITLSVQTVTPFVDDGKVKTICSKNLCLLIQGEAYTGGDTDELCVPVLLGKEGAIRLIEELEEFIRIPF